MGAGIMSVNHIETSPNVSQLGWGEFSASGNHFGKQLTSDLLFPQLSNQPGNLPLSAAHRAATIDVQHFHFLLVSSRPHISGLGEFHELIQSTHPGNCQTFDTVQESALEDKSAKKSPHGINQ